MTGTPPTRTNNSHLLAAARDRSKKAIEGATQALTEPNQSGRSVSVSELARTARVSGPGSTPNRVCWVAFSSKAGSTRLPLRVLNPCNVCLLAQTT